MILILTKKAPDRLRGRLSRYLLEVDAGVFVGRLGARLRDHLWREAVEQIGAGYVLQVWSDSTAPQGFRHRARGDNRYSLRQENGLFFTFVAAAKSETPSSGK